MYFLYYNSKDGSFSVRGVTYTPEEHPAIYLNLLHYVNSKKHVVRRISDDVTLHEISAANAAKILY